jgi:hypothetical protein
LISYGICYTPSVSAVRVIYEVVSKIFRTGSTIYTAVVVARSTDPNRLNCELRAILRLLRRLRENVRRRRHELWREQTWLLHHDNAPHNSVLTQQFLVKNKVAVIPRPPYSLDLAPCDFRLFQNTKLILKGRQFDTTEEIQAESQRVLDTLTEKGLP